MTKTQLEKHNKEIVRNVVKALKWVVKEIKTNKEVTSNYRCYKNSDTFYITYKLEGSFSFDICYDPNSSQDFKSEDTRIRAGFTLYQDHNSLNFDIKVDDEGIARYINTYDCYTKSYIEIDNPKLNALIQDGISFLMKKYEVNRTDQSQKNLNILKDFLKDK